ncbi:hypothetical protein BEI67_18850 [Photobacterium damselae subsp. piscicida]|nr:hypothetical protein BEI67_18850 [Photobacterium damselae subsp. piscicida]
MLANLAGIFILYHYKSPLLYWPYPMSNKPRKKKKKPTKKCRPVQASSAFDSYEQYETTMDNVIQLLNAQYDIAPPKDHDEEIAPIYQYLIDKFGDTSTTTFK